MTTVEQINLPLDDFEDVEKHGTQGRICGVYVLFYGKRVIYVGQSVDVRSRIANHQREKPYTRCLVKELPQEVLTKVENALITVLQPPLNRAGVPKERRESEFAHRLFALADSVKRVAGSNGWHDANELAKAEAIIRFQAASVSEKHQRRGWL